MTRTNKIALFSTIAVTAAVALFAVRERNKKEISEIITKIKSGEGAQGTVDDIKFSSAFNPEYYKSRPVSELTTVASAQARAKTIYDAKGFFYDDEEVVFKVFNNAKSKAVISQISEAFAKKYGTPLYQFLRSMMWDSELAIIQARLKQLK